jgi:MoxR-like ATPase
VDYAVRLVRATRPRAGEAPEFVKQFVSWGAGPRAAQNLILGAKARAIIAGRCNVTCSDVKALAHPVLRHRIFVNFNADAEGLTADDLVDRLLESVKEAGPEEYR